MITVAKVTIKRLLQDKTVTIALFIIPIIIITVFSQMNASTSQPSKIKLGIIENQIQNLSLSQKDSFKWFYAESKSELESMVLNDKVAAGVIIENGQLVEILSKTQELGDYVHETFSHPTPIKETKAVDKNKTITIILNFLINYMMFSMIFIATDLASLKSQNILKRLTTMPLSTAALYGGQLLAFLAMLTLQVFEINFVIYLIVGVPLSMHLLLSTLVLILMISLVLSLGLLVTRISDNPSLLPIICNVIMIPLMMVSGTFMPVDHHPLFSKLKLLAPQYWVVDAIQTLNSGNTHIYTHLGVLAAMTFIVFSISVAGRKVDALA